ncbi:MAG TPA: O-antigen ligase family protein [Ignavibacteriaceae bacterium]|nr:O-antigen ligase family protein [Ignavibacteriaceae bacterium]
MAEDFNVEKNIYFKIAILAFVAYMFFMFFGTKIPFQAKGGNSSEGGGGNIVNQIIYPAIFLLSLISLFVRRLDALAIIKKEKLLTIFLIWCLFSIIWSYSPIDTAKRFFRTLTVFAVTLSLLVHTTSTKEILNFIKPVLYLYVFLSIIVCIVIPGAKDYQFHTWRGFEDSKNVLGGVAVVCILLCSFIYKVERGGAKFVASIAVLFSLALLFGSRSMSSIMAFLIVALVGLLLSFDKLFKPLGLGRALSAIIILFVGAMGTIVLLIYPEILAIFTEAVGKDPSFTGRTDLWTSMFISISKHPFLGTGYRAFWSVHPPSDYLIHINSLFIWLPNESHNGFIDIANEVGIIGLTIFLVMLIRYFLSMRQLDSPNPWKWLIIAPLIVNLQESSMVGFTWSVGAMLIISYMILFAQLWRQDDEAEYETG